MAQLVYRKTTLMLLLICVAASSNCANIKNTTLTATRPSNLTVPSVRAFWAEALSLAKEWYPDAYVTVVRGDANSKGIPKVSFSFQSPSNDDAMFEVNCSMTGCSSLELNVKPEYPSSMQCLPITLDDFTLDSTYVLDVGLQQGGENYAQGPTTRVFLMLSRPVPYCTGPVVWSVSFMDLATTEVFEVLINAATGEIVEIRD